jgi:FMN phosphatase YigB (HAD superfamily)
MKRALPVTTLFLDVGGVLLTNGWDHLARKRAARNFNESRAVNAHRIRTFRLEQLADTFISSCFVRMRKPDIDIFRLALDLAQTPAEQVAFIDNTAMFVKIAEGLGMRGIVHKDHESTSAKLASFGLQMDGGGLQDTEQTTQSGVDRMTAEVVTQL